MFKSLLTAAVCVTLVCACKDETPPVLSATIQTVPAPTMPSTENGEPEASIKTLGDLGAPKPNPVDASTDVASYKVNFATVRILGASNAKIDRVVAFEEHTDEDEEEHANHEQKEQTTLTVAFPNRTYVFQDKGCSFTQVQIDGVITEAANIEVSADKPLKISTQSNLQNLLRELNAAKGATQGG